MDLPQEQRPVPAVYELVQQHPDLWQESESNTAKFLGKLTAENIITPYEAQALYKDAVDDWADARRLVGAPPSFTERIQAWLWEQVREYLVPAFDTMLQSLWEFIKKTIGDFVWAVKEVIAPVVVQALANLNAKFEDLGRRAYDGLSRLMMESGPITPERAPALAMKLYTFAFSMGMTAHGIASGVELLHPLKRIGVHHIAAMVGDFAGFGRIAAATIGVMTSVSLAQPMRYAVNDLVRQVIPDDRLLIELRSKREIDKPEFDKAMGYQGFSKAWIDVIERWQWKDPRMFELMRVADIGIEQGPPPPAEMWWFKKFGITGEKLKDWWLYRKLMRAGYEDVDLDVLVRTIHRREISFAMTYVRTAIRRNYRWGYLTEEELEEWIDRLGLPEKAKQWILWAGDLDREYFYRQDLVRLYTLQFRNDIITDDDFLVALVAMDIPLIDAELTVRIERARKHPQITQPVIKAAQKATTKVQTKYVQLYIGQYKKELITKDGLLTSLLAIGIHPELAEVTCALEEAKKLPKP